MDNQKAVGSIWNVNSWHWQMKNYTQQTKKLLQSKLKDLTYETQKGIKISHEKIKFTKSQAQVNIRKGKQILIYDFQLELDILAQNNVQQSKGSYKVKQILSDDLNDMIIQDVKANQKNKCGDEIKKWIKSHAKEKIIQVFKEMETDLQKLQSNPTKLQQDQKKRQEALKFTEKTKQQKGQQKQRLLQQQKNKQRKQKQQAFKKHFQKTIQKN